jgi:hypothetical protein
VVRAKLLLLAFCVYPSSILANRLDPEDEEEDDDDWVETRELADRPCGRRTRSADGRRNRTKDDDDHEGEEGASRQLTGCTPHMIMVMHMIL